MQYVQGWVGPGVGMPCVHCEWIQPGGLGVRGVHGRRLASGLCARLDNIKSVFVRWTQVLAGDLCEGETPCVRSNGIVSGSMYVRLLNAGTHCAVRSRGGSSTARERS
jgi:hypothetical protein